MKTAVIASPLIASESMQGSVMGMDAQGMSQATYFMRDKIYSNKIGAVVREYSCNAIDEHEKHQISRPVEIGLRRENDELVFFVRDYARGLNDHDVRNVFGMYFRSTKSSSNESIGGFGIGSKAGHCYNDTFFVTSFHQGQKTTYTCMLGGGETGVPVGHIYEIDSAKTNESGLEISMPINMTDKIRFDQEIQNFINLSPANIVGILSNGQKISPVKTVVAKKIGTFDLRLVALSSNDYSNRRSYYVQMGGVNYARYDLPHGYNIKAGHCLVVNLPIGSMSIPISREAFEDTPSNNKVKNQVQEVIASLIEEDFAQFKTKTPLELINDALSSLNNSDYSGEIFSTSKSRLFQDIWPLISNIRQSNAGGVIQKLNNKFVLVAIPDNFAHSYWVSKLADFSRTNGRNYYFAPEHAISKASANLTAEFEIKMAKKLDYPRVKRDSKRYSISNNHGSCGSYSPLELHNHAAQIMNLSAAKDEKEAQNQVKKYISNLKNTRQLLNFVIADRTRFQKNNRTIGYYSSSQKFVDEMKNLGWLVYGSAEYKQQWDNLKKHEEKQAELDNAVATSKRRWLEFSPRTRRLIAARPENALRIVKFWQCIRKENSLRAKMIVSFENAGYGCPIYTRDQFRQILKLK